MHSSTKRSWWLAILLAAAIAGCGGVKPPIPAPPKTSATTVIRWALGPDHRGGGVPDEDAYLLLLPTPKAPSTKPNNTPSAGAQQEAAGIDLSAATPSNVPSGSTTITGCLRASSFLPALEGDPRIFFVIQGKLHVVRRPGEAPELLQGANPDLALTQLLAFETNDNPSRLLVAAKREGEKAEDLWLLTLSDQAVVESVRLSSGGALGDQKAFFTAYRVPRCLNGDQRCLIPNSDSRSAYIDEESVRGGSQTSLMTLGNVDVLDASWAAADGSAVYLLQICR